MGAVAAALDRGQTARRRKNSRYEPVTVNLHGGWLAARVRDLTRDGEEIGVYAHGRHGLLRTDLGHTADGDVKCFPIRDGELKRVARAMLDGGDDLVREVWATARKAWSVKKKGSRARRKR